MTPPEPTDADPFVDLVAQKRRRRALGLGVLVLVVAFVAAGVALADQARLRFLLVKTPPDAAAAQPRLRHLAEAIAAPVFASRCAACHGRDLRGNPARGVPDLLDADWIFGQGLASQIERTIAYGIRSGDPKTRNLAVMPSYVRGGTGRYKITPISPTEMNDVVDFLFSMEGRPHAAAAAARGADVYANKAACYDCHTADGRGDQEVGAPNLADGVWLYGHGTRADILRAMEEGHAGVCPAWLRRLGPLTVRALAVSLHDRAARSPSPAARSGS